MLLLMIFSKSASAASPTITAVSPTNGGYTFFDVNPSLKFSITADSAIETLTARVDNQLVTAVYDANTATWSLNPTWNLNDGPHSYAVTAIDANNNPAMLKVNF